MAFFNSFLSSILFVSTVLCKLSPIPFKINSSFTQIARRYIKECEDYSPNIQHEIIRWWYICKVGGKGLHTVDLYGKTAILDVFQQKYKKHNIAYLEHKSLVWTVKIALISHWQSLLALNYCDEKVHSLCLTIERSPPHHRTVIQILNRYFGFGKWSELWTACC